MVNRLTIQIWLRCAVLFLLGIGVGIATLPCSASAPSTGSVVLAWNPSVSTDVVGYNIYYGVACGVYNNKMFVAGSTWTNATITGLAAGTQYYFAATAVDSLGVESPFSNETTYSVPLNAPPTLDALPDLTINENAGLQTVNLSGISSGAANQVQPLTVTAASSNPGLIPNPTLNYTSPNATGTLSFAPVANGNGTATVTVTVNNNGASNNIVTQSFTVTVNAVNQPPTLNALSDVAMNENAGLQTVNLSGISSGAANQVQPLTVTAASSNPGLIPNPTLNYTSPNATGTLSFAPVANGNGTATVTVTVNNNGASNNIVTQSFTVTVNAVNQPPTLNALSDVAMNENAGLQTVNLSGISSGAANQVQPLTVTAASSNPGLIPNPTLNYTSPNATGTLNFAPAANNYGTATVTVTVNNSGASNNIVTQSFTVTVNAVNQPPTLDVLNGGRVPTILIPPQTQTAEAGCAVNFAASVTGSPFPTCRWFFNGNAIAGCTNRLWLSGIQASNVGAYTLVVSNVWGAATSAPAMLSVIAPVERRAVPAVSLMAQPGSSVGLDYCDVPGSTAGWTTIATMTMSNTSQFYFDVSEPLPPQRFYRVWQSGTPSVAPALNLDFVPAITLSGNAGDSLRLDYINQTGPTDAWVTLDTVTLTNSSQLYFDVSMLGQPARLYRIVPVP